jgi:hypothetical protein
MTMAEEVSAPGSDSGARADLDADEPLDEDEEEDNDEYSKPIIEINST